MDRNPVGWFEIPVNEMKRAINFYETVFGMKLNHQVLGDLEMAWFPELEDAPGSTGSLVKHKEYYKPSPDGTLLYFTSPTGDISNELQKVENAGGKIISPKKLISNDIGYMALIIDTEGNRIAFHSRR